MKKKESNIIFRVTENEKEEIEKRADQCGLSVSNYARKMLLNGKIISLEKSDIINLKQIGNNINQLARHANSTRQLKTENILFEYENLKPILMRIFQHTQVKK